MKENKELKDLLTTGTIVEVYNKREEEEDTVKYIGATIQLLKIYTKMFSYEQMCLIYF